MSAIQWGENNGFFSMAEARSSYSFGISAETSADEKPNQLSGISTSPVKDEINTASQECFDSAVLPQPVISTWFT